MLKVFRRGKKSNAGTMLKKTPKMPELDDFLARQDYEGAISVLNHKLRAGGVSGDEENSLELWLAFCHFRLRKYDQAADVYQGLMEKKDAPAELGVYLAVCKFHMKEYVEARAIADKSPKTGLCNRLQMNIALFLNDEKRILQFHHNLGGAIEDKLCLAGVNYHRLHFQEAIETYTEVMRESPNLLALNVYMAICFAKQDNPHVAYLFIKNYLRNFPNSPFANNVLLSLIYRTISARTTLDEQSELARNIDREGLTILPEMEKLLKGKLYPDIERVCKHNLVLFKNCETALQELPVLMKHVPEARLNLILYHLRRNSVKEAADLANDLDPINPHEYVVKALALHAYGVSRATKDHIESLQMAEQFFQMVGENASFRDKILGRQAMSSAHFLAGKYSDANLFFESIKDYFLEDDTFLMNYGQSLLMCGEYAEAKDAFIRVSGPERDKSLYKSMLARCYAKNKEPQMAWDMVMKMTHPEEKKKFLLMLADDCYSVQEYYYSVKAFHELERIDHMNNPSYWNGKKGAVAGLFRKMVLASKDDKKELAEKLKECLVLVERNYHPSCDFLLKTIREHGSSHQIDLG